jgi:hypothetical protein
LVYTRRISCVNHIEGVQKVPFSGSTTGHDEGAPACSVSKALKARERLNNACNFPETNFISARSHYTQSTHVWRSSGRDYAEPCDWTASRCIYHANPTVVKTCLRHPFILVCDRLSSTGRSSLQPAAQHDCTIWLGPNKYAPIVERFSPLGSLLKSSSTKMQ